MVLTKRLQWSPSTGIAERPSRRGRAEGAASLLRPYDRRIELPRVLPLWPHELEDETPEGRWSVVRKLRRALRAERQRGIAGHWTYDLQRHADLLRVYRLEIAACGRLGSDLRRPRPVAQPRY